MSETTAHDTPKCCPRYCRFGAQVTPKYAADKLNGTIIIDSRTVLDGIPSIAWEYKLGNRSALEWILDQYKEKKPSDVTIAENFNTYKFADYKEQIIELLQSVCSVGIKTLEIVNHRLNSLQFQSNTKISLLVFSNAGKVNLSYLILCNFGTNLG